MEPYEDSIVLTIIHQIFQDVKGFEMINGTRQEYVHTKLVKQIRKIKWIKKEGITMVDEYITPKTLSISKKWCVIYDKFSNEYYVAAHPAAAVRERLSRRTNKIGY